MAQSKIDYTKPIRINDDVWFYPTKKGFSFVAWTRERHCVQFRVPHDKLKKFIPNNEKN
jgi:hypothetical protein